MDMKTQRIAYIGKKPIKKDNIASTGIMWDGFGDIQEVPHGAAVKMLNHPDVWITEKQFIQRYPVELEQEPAPPPIPSPVQPPVKNPEAQQSAANTGLSDAGGKPAPDTVALDPPSPIDDELFPVFEKLTGDDISKHGPKLPKVRELLGRDDVSVTDVKESFVRFNNSKAVAE